MPLQRNQYVRRTREHLECHICIETFVRPKILPCGHSFCETCIKSYLEKKASERRRVVGTEITCPVCRKPIDVSDIDKPIEEWTELFPLNYLVISLLDEDYEEENLSMCNKHANKQVQYFCADHNDLACSRCLIDAHRTCKVIDVEEEAVKQFSGTVQDKLQALKATLVVHIDQLSDVIDNIYQETYSIIDDVKVFRAEVDEMLKDVEDNVTRSVNQLCAAETVRLNTERELYRQNVHKIETNISMIASRMGSSNTIESVKVLQKAQDNLKNGEKELLVAEKPFIPVTFKWDAQLEKNLIKDTLTQMRTRCLVRCQTVSDKSEVECQGQNINVDTTSSSDILNNSNSLSLPQPNDQPLWFRKAEHVANIDTKKQKSDAHECDITTSVVLRDNRIVLTDCNNNKIRIYSTDACTSTYLKERRFNGRPWGIANFSENETKIAVTFPFVRRVVILDIDDWSIPPTRFRTAEKCYGVATYKDILIIATLDDGHYIVFLDMAGTELRKVGLQELRNMNAMKPISIAVDENKDCIYVACHGDKGSQGCLVTMDTSGKLTHILTDADLRCCYGCAVDRKGNVYICGYASSTVHVLSRNGDATKTILTARDGINQPSHIRFFPNSDTFLLSEILSNVKVFKLTTFDKD